MLIFSGFFIRFKELPTVFKPFTYVSFFRYGLEGSVQAVYGNNRSNLACFEPFCYYKNVGKFLKDIDMIDSSFTLDVTGFLVWICMIQVFLYAALKFKMCGNR